MFLKRFLWFLSFSVFVAGVIYYFSGLAGAAKEPAAGTRPRAELLIGSHAPDEILLSRVIGRNSTFWYLTAADRSVTSDVLHGTALAFRTVQGGESLFLQAELRPLAGLDRSLEARVGTVEADGLAAGSDPR